jgi:hypothetical protein
MLPIEAQAAWPGEKVRAGACDVNQGFGSRAQQIGRAGTAPHRLVMSAALPWEGILKRETRPTDRPEGCRAHFTRLLPGACNRLADQLRAVKPYSWLTSALPGPSGL